ncbi:MAG: hypothetical protein J6K73_07990 [Clostridia bacterium]|nr:hypothetical protein [Clostridia bacterium]
MKKIVALVMAFVALFVSTACADPVVINDNFSIRNGITYKMPAEEIKKIERNNGSRTGDSSVFWGKADLDYLTELMGKETGLVYWHDENDCLKEFQYMLVMGYNSMESTLRGKYGDPQYVNNPPAIDTRRFVVCDKLKPLDPIVKDYAGWMVKYNDCYVLIEMSNIYAKGLGGNLGFLNYCVLSYEEIEQYQKNQEMVEENVSYSIDNDL